MSKQQQNRLLLEFVVLFGGLPLTFIGQPRMVKFIVLWIFAAYAIYMIKRVQGRRLRDEWNWAGVKQGIGEVVVRALVWCSALNMFTLMLVPERLFAFPIERTYMWSLVMLLYPLISVLPQELVYRTLYHSRYAPVLFPSRFRQILVSAFAFGWAHIFFENWVAIFLCFVGGAIFSTTYLKYRSLALVFIEHSIYGCFVFTVGLGWYFYGVIYST